MRSQCRIAMHDISEEVGWLLEIAWANYFRVLGAVRTGRSDRSAERGEDHVHAGARNPRKPADRRVVCVSYSVCGRAWATKRLHADTANQQLIVPKSSQEVSLQSESRRQLAHEYVLCEAWEKALKLFEQCVEVLDETESAFELMLMGPDRARTYLALGPVGRRGASPWRIHRNRTTGAGTAPRQAVARRIQGQVFAARRPVARSSASVRRGDCDVGGNGQSSGTGARPVPSAACCRQARGALDDAVRDLGACVTISTRG